MKDTVKIRKGWPGWHFIEHLKPRPFFRDAREAIQFCHREHMPYEVSRAVARELGLVNHKCGTIYMNKAGVR